MKLQSNIFEAGAVDILAMFEDYFEGDTSRIALAIGSTPLNDPCRNAIDKSLETFGYGAEACSYASLSPRSEDIEGGDINLDPQALFLLVEALDPIMLILADENAARLAAQAYRAAFDLDVPTRIFGRPTVVFKDLPALMESPEGKQKAWSLFKSFPKR